MKRILPIPFDDKEYSTLEKALREYYSDYKSNFIYLAKWALCEFAARIKKEKIEDGSHD